MLHPCEPICPLSPSQLRTAPAWNCSASCLLTPGLLGQVAWCLLARDSGRDTGGKKGGCLLLCPGKTHTSDAIRECTSLLGWLICHPSKTSWQLAAHSCVQIWSPDQGTEGIHLTQGTPSSFSRVSPKSCDFFLASLDLLGSYLLLVKDTAKWTHWWCRQLQTCTLDDWGDDWELDSGGEKEQDLRARYLSQLHHYKSIVVP